MRDIEIVIRIEKIRAKNNKNWMDLLRLALKHAPAEAKKILKEISICDQKINAEVTKLGQ